MTFALVILVCATSLNDCRAVQHPDTFASRSACIDAIPAAIEAVQTIARRTECVEIER